LDDEAPTVEYKDGITEERLDQLRKKVALDQALKARI